jgi:predicted NAD/FAD-binding protein
MPAQLFQRPVWRTVEGSSTYVERLAQPFRDRIRTSTPVRAIRRTDGGIEVTTSKGGKERFDHAVIGAHADPALRLLADPSPEERHLLGAFAYGRNETVLHRDPSLMPKRRKVWSSWNYLACSKREATPPPKPCVTY